MVNSYFLRKSYTLTESAIFDRIKLQVNRIFYDNDLRITPETKLIDDLGADSLELLEFNLALENAFDIMILDKTDNKSIQDFILTISEILNIKEKGYRKPPAKDLIISDEAIFNLVKKRIYDLYPEKKFIITPKTPLFDNSTLDPNNRELLRLALEKILRIKIKNGGQNITAVEDVVDFIGANLRANPKNIKYHTFKPVANKKNLDMRIEKKYALSKEAIFTRIKERISDLYPEKRFIIKPETKFSGNLGRDNREFAELILTFADTFKIKMPRQPHKNIKTVRNVIDYVYITLNNKEKEYNESAITTAKSLTKRDLTREIIFKEYALTETSIFRFVNWQIKCLVYPNTKVKDMPTITPKTDIKKELDIDIFEFEKLILKFESIFEIIIPNEISEIFKSVQDVIDYVHLTLNAKEEENQSLFLLYIYKIQDPIVIAKLIKSFFLHIDYSNKSTTIAKKLPFGPNTVIKKYGMTKGAIFDRMNLIIQRQLELIASTDNFKSPPNHGRPASAKVRVTGETTFNEISTDSLEFTEIMFIAESGFGIDMPREASEDFVSVQDVVDYIFVMLAIKEIEGEKRKKLPGELAQDYGLVQ